jgi:hypothetical protein
MISAGFHLAGGRGGGVLREEELNLLVCELAQLCAEHVVYAYMVCISAIEGDTVSSWRVTWGSAVRRAGERNGGICGGLTKGTQQ